MRRNIFYNLFSLSSRRKPGSSAPVRAPFIKAPAKAAALDPGFRRGDRGGYARSLVYGILLAGLAAACTLGGPPLDTGKAFMFALRPVNVIHQGAQSESLVVALPTAAPELDTYRIALIRDDRQWDYYAGARWAEFLPLLVRDNLVRTLGNARHFKAVTSDEAGLEGEKILKTEIGAFHAMYAKGGNIPIIKIQMTATLLTRIERTPLASFSVSAEKKAAGNSLAAIQAAFALAFKEAQGQLLDKVSSKLP